MKKFALLAGLFVFAPMTWAQDYNIKNGLPSETYITCAEANEMAKTDSAQVAEIVAVMGNASVASRDLKIEQSPELSAKVVEKLNQVCAKDGNDSNLLIVFYVQIMPDDFVMQLHRF